MSSCVSDLFPQAALDAMVRESGKPQHDDGHTDCYYAGLLLAALPHLITDDMAERVARAFEGDDAFSQYDDITRRALLDDVCRALAAAFTTKDER